MARVKWRLYCILDSYIRAQDLIISTPGHPLDTPSLYMLLSTLSFIVHECSAILPHTWHSSASTRHCYQRKRRSWLHKFTAKIQSVRSSDFTQYNIVRRTKVRNSQYRSPAKLKFRHLICHFIVELNSTFHDLAKALDLEQPFNLNQFIEEFHKDTW